MSELFIDSASLRDIKRFLELYPELQKAFGVPARFKVVLDANVAIADLLHKLARPNVSRTAIEECARAQTLEVHAPRHLDHEMLMRTIPKAARKKKIDPDLLLAMWVEYREMLIWDETLTGPVDDDPNCADPDDVPYVLLQEKIGAVGILSRDKHISALGGTPLQLEFAITVCRYGRAASVHLNLYVNGAFIGTFGFAAIKMLILKAKDFFMALPPALRTFIIVGIAVAVIHPTSRQWISDKLPVMKDVGLAAWPEIVNLIKLANLKQLEAENELKKAQSLVPS